ncbi:hypothetical protein [Clostridium sp.]|uniref:hypothetical protein n=1 Tax=Clostridium sp. TaxID=1506 RepID=UPI003F412EC4
MNVCKKIKKDGFITLEVIAITIMTLSVTGMITAMTINNFRKAEFYQVDDDVRSISLEYEDAIVSAEEFINSSVEIIDNVKRKISNNLLGDEFQSFYYIYKYDKNTMISIIIRDSYIRLEHNRLKSIKKIHLEAKLITENNEEKIILVPKYYKTDFVNI